MSELKFMMAVWRIWEECMGEVECTNCPIVLPNFNVTHVAHVLTKAAHPEYQYVLEGVMPLCFDCHRQYDQEDFSVMPMMSHVYRLIDILSFKPLHRWDGKKFIYDRRAN